MGLKEIQRLADALGILSTEQRSVRDLIQSIQFEEGLMPCYSEAWSAPCQVSECPFCDVCSSHMDARARARH